MKTKNVTLVWTGRKRYLGGRTIKRGDTFKVNRRDAMLYKVIGHAIDAPAQVDILERVQPQAAKPAPVQPADDGQVSLRAEYETVFGRKPFNGWGPQQLRDKITAYRRRDIRAEE